MVVNVVGGEGEDNQDGAGEEGGGGEVGGQGPDGETGGNGEHVIVIRLLGDVGDTVFDQSGTVNTQVGTDERGPPGSREGGGGGSVTRTGVVGLDHGVAEGREVVNVLGQVVREELVGEPDPGDGGGQDPHEVIQVFEHVTRHGTETEGEGDVQITERAEEGQAQAGNQIAFALGTSGLDDTDAEEEDDSLLQVLGVILVSEKLDDWVFIETGQHF